MVKRYACVLTIALLLSAAACSRRPELAPDVRQLPTAELAKQAPIIVVGVCKGFDLLSGTVQQDNRTLKLGCVSLDVENTLRGTVNGRRMSYYVFGTLNGQAGPAVNVVPRPGQRVAVFLREERNVLRSIADVYGALVLIHSGEHRTLPSGNAAEQLSYILLEPGDGMSPDLYASQLPNAVSTSLNLVGPEKTYSLLQEAIKTAPPVARLPVCSEIYSKLVDDGCLRSIGTEASKIADREFRLKYERLAAQLAETPSGWLEQHVQTEGREWSKQRLALLTASETASVRNNACSLLARDFSERPAQCRR